MVAHGLTQRDVAAGAGLGLSRVNAIARGISSPTTRTVNKLLRYCRSIDGSVKYEDLFEECTRSIQ